MSIISVDVEADGKCPGLFSMVSFGAVLVDGKHNTTFYGKTKPITGNFNPEALAVSNFSRQDHEQFDDPVKVMQEFSAWIKQNSKGRPVFLSDNPAFDWQFINYYFALAEIENPFGFSARRIGDFYAGLEKDWFAATKWKGLRKTKHTHHPVDDAKGNAEALIEMARIHKIKIPL